MRKEYIPWWHMSNIGGGESFCDEYQTVYDSFTTPPSDDVADAQNTMVQSLVDEGVWTKLDVFYLLAQESNGDGEAQKNWVNPGTFDSTLVNTGDLTFTSLEGIKGGGTNGYQNTGYNPSTAAGNYTQDSASMFLYSRTQSSEAGSDWDCGVIGTTHDAGFNIRGGSGNLMRMNISAAQAAGSVADSRGLFIANREDSTSEQFYANGVKKIDSTVNSTGLPNYNVYVHCASLTNVPYGYVTRQFSVFGVGASLSEQDRTNLQTAIETYMDSNSKGVIS